MNTGRRIDTVDLRGSSLNDRPDAIRPIRPTAGPMLVAGEGRDAPRPGFARAPLPTGAGCAWTALSLFSGGGGLDLGFLGEGVRADAAYDHSAAAIDAYALNLPGAARLADLATVSPAADCDLLLAGAPCQGFSTAGKRLVDDPRNALLMRVVDIAIATGPRVVIVENVPAALSGAHASLWHGCEERLRLAGWNIRRLDVHGGDSGLAQRRRRLFLIAWHGSDCIRIDPPAVAAPALRDSLAGVWGAPDHLPSWPVDGVDLAIARHIGPGQKLCNVRNSPRAVATWDVPEVFGAIDDAERRVLEAIRSLRRRARRRNFGDGDPVRPAALVAALGDAAPDVARRLVEKGYLRLVEGDYELRHTYNGKYRRLHWDEPSPTVDTHFGRPSLFLHPTENRGLSQREAARIQGFPDAYRLGPAAHGKFEVMGNAVPPPMAARVAAFVREAILKA